MKSFLEQTAEKILTKHGRDLSRVLVLMPNQRACTYFRNELKKQATQAVFAPEISTLQNWLLSQSKLTLIDNIELVTELFNCHREIGGSLTLDEFVGTANILLSDFDELDLQMVHAKSFFKNLELLQSMKMYEPGEQPTEYKQQYRKFWEDFGKLYHMLRQKLFDKKSGYRGMILRQVSEHIESITVNSSHVYLIGFGLLNKNDEVAVSYLINNANAELIWDADNYYVRNTMNEAGNFFRKNRIKFRQSEKNYGNGISTGKKHVQIIGTAKNVGQVKVVADILQNKLEVNEQTALDTVIVLPDEKLLSLVIANLPACVPSVNITMGLTVAGSKPAAFLDIIFRLYTNSIKYQSPIHGQRFYYKDVFELLQHSFIRYFLKDAETSRFIQAMKKQNRVLIRYEELEVFFKGVLAKFLFLGEDAAAFASNLHQVMSQLLNELIQQARSGNSGFETDVEVAYRMLNIITNAQDIFVNGDTLSIKTFIALLKEDFRNTRVPLQGDPVQGLQIMGLQETRTLDFKNVIFLSANEGILPSGKNLRSYIPYELRYEFLTTHKERDELTAYLFYRLFQKAENIFVLYNTEPDELGGGEKSRFVLQIQHELQTENPNAVITDTVFAIDPPPAVAEAKIVISKDEKILSKLNEILTGSGISPSALNTYINCSLQYYFRYIGGLRERDEMEESIEAATIGSAVHFALEKIYEKKLAKTLTVDFFEAEAKNREQIENLIRAHLSEKFDRDSLTTGKNLLLFKVCAKLVEEYLKAQQLEFRQLNDSGVSVTLEMLEAKLEHTVLVLGKQIKVTGRVDRVDKTTDAVHIADYKTSKYSSIPVLDSKTWSELTSDPKYSKPVQLLVYAWLYQSIYSKHVPIRSGIYWLRESDKQLDTLRVSKTDDLLTAETIKLFEEKLISVIAEMLNPQVPFAKTTDEKRCVYCEFNSICERS